MNSTNSQDQALTFKTAMKKELEELLIHGGKLSQKFTETRFLAVKKRKTLCSKTLLNILDGRKQIPSLSFHFQLHQRSIKLLCLSNLLLFANIFSKLILRLTKIIQKKTFSTVLTYSINENGL